MAQWIGCKFFSKGRDGRSVSVIVPHISEASTIGSIDNTFNGSRQASTHYAVDDVNVHQYVQEGDTAWAVGNWDGNCRSISIECVGTTANPPSKATLDNCARLMVDIANRHGLGKLVLGQNVKRHKDYSATSCPSTLDLTYLMSKVAELQGGGSASSVQPAPSGDLNALADAVIRGDYGDGDARKQALGANYDAVQAIVNQKLGVSGAAPSTNSVNLEDLATRVINGEFGNGDERKKALGANYDAVQAIVNQRLNGSSPVSSVDLESLATRAIRGEFGDGDDRKKALGANYDAVQAIVNKRYGL